MSEHLFICGDCGVVELNKHGACAKCGNVNLAPLHTPEPEHPKPLWQTPPQYGGSL